ncbi:unnamed protein product [Vitrella brassicaformis CCMP3155]|uniref:Uncharacterized protein n=1 Tax=Vitrella brassicaformis (strain CCMP3155) TaxID=1169540 RepID=A0A0G4H8U8_VITBC|nr:unnamed protein product [Vitrella brassicaformis CCMP3155]|eukprot:CEM40124.1 unnamed protein product [Vitrella brassicaformis CCMP3155]
MLLFESIFGGVFKAGCAMVPVCKTKCLVHGTCHLAIADAHRRRRAALALATGGAILWATITIQRCKERIMRAMEGLFGRREGRHQPHARPAHPQDRRQLQEEAPRPRITFGGSPRLLAIQDGPRPLAIEDSPRRRQDGTVRLEEEAIAAVAAAVSSALAVILPKVYPTPGPPHSRPLKDNNTNSNAGVAAPQMDVLLGAWENTSAGMGVMVPVGDSLEGKGVWDIAAGDAHSAALTFQGVIYTWGARDNGELGRDGDHVTPMLVAKMPVPVKKITCGGHHTAALGFDGRVYLWGIYSASYAMFRHEGFPRRRLDVTGLPTEASNEQVRGFFEGRLPTTVSHIRRDADDTSKARLVLADEGAVGLAVALNHAVFNGQRIGVKVGGAVKKQLYPYRLPGLMDVEQLASGDNHTVALSKEVLYVWGANDFSQLTFPEPPATGPTDRAAFDAALFPTRRTTHQLGLGKEADIRRVWACGNATFVAAVLAANDGKRHYGCGSNSCGEVGISTKTNTVDRLTEIPALFDKNVVSLCGGQFHTIALIRDGSVMTWGKGENTGLDVSNRLVDVTVPCSRKVEGVRFLSVGAGRTHTVATNQTGDIFSWGVGQSGQLGSAADSDVEYQPHLMDSLELRRKFVLKADGGGDHSVELAWRQGDVLPLSPIPQEDWQVFVKDKDRREKEVIAARWEEVMTRREWEWMEAEDRDTPLIFGRTYTAGRAAPRPPSELAFKGSPSSFAFQLPPSAHLFGATAAAAAASPTSLQSFQSAPLFGPPQQADKDSGAAAPAAGAGAAEGAASASPSSSPSSRRRGRRGRLSGPSLSFGTGAPTGHQGSGEGAAVPAAAAASSAAAGAAQQGGGGGGGEGGFGPTQEGVQLFQGATGDLQYGSSASGGRRREEEQEEEEDHSWMDAKRKRR